ncbi:MAG: 2-carboxy-1,4-naphthoquinone phytyltransferase [Snowella sp.]|nr:2-carboxy-1,4-naphthoquinone phytyltransferase [Snowella sp.]
MTTTHSLAPTQKQLWFAAIKPPMYSVAVIPICVGTAVAFAQSHQVNFWIFSIFFLSAITIVAWLNLSNDVFDADTGIDKNKAHSVVNLTGNKRLIYWISNGFLGLGLLGIFLISWLQQDITVLAIVGLACVLGYSYQGPPFRLGYQGLGELICFITFGPLAIAAVYYSQTQAFNNAVIAPSVLVGISTSLVLFCSHFHQVEDDLAAGKRSPIVRLGTARGANVLAYATLSLYALTAIFIGLNMAPLSSGLVFLSLPFAIQLINYVRNYHDQPTQISRSKFVAIKLHFVSGILLSLGYILGAT